MEDSPIFKVGDRVRFNRYLGQSELVGTITEIRNGSVYLIWDSRRYSNHYMSSDIIHLSPLEQLADIR